MTGALQAVYDRLRPLCGQEHSQPLGVIDGRDLERFAVVTGAPDVWTGDEQARTAPPLYLSSVMGWGAGPGEDELRPDGSGLDETRGLPLDGVRLMGAGQELEFHEPVPEGARVVAYTSLVDVQRKDGSSGELLIMTIRRRFTDEDGQLLVTCHESFIAR